MALGTKDCMEMSLAKAAMAASDMAFEIESLRAENAKLKEDLANRVRQLSEVVKKMRRYEAINRDDGTTDWRGENEV